MPIFKYAAVGADNRLNKGELRALSRRRALLELETRGMITINIEKTPSQTLQKLRTYSTISRLDRIQVTRFLYTFLSSGLSLNQAIKIAGEQTENARLKDILEKIGLRIKEGESLSRAMMPHERIFTSYYIKLIQVGEDSGTLEETLHHLLQQQEKEYELLSNIRGAMVYPAVVIFAAVAAVVFLMTFVIPTIAEVLTDYGSELPIQTKILVAVSGFFVDYGLYMIPVALIAPFLFLRIIRTRIGKRLFEKLLFMTPVIKKVVIEYNTARVMRALWAPLKSGLNVNKALELTAETCSNSHYRQTIEQSAELIRRGIPLSEILKGYKDLYPPSVYGMIEVGENTGKIDEMLKRLSQFYEDSVQHTFKNIASIIEPFLILFIGVIIGFIAVSVLTPIWKFSETI